MRLYYLCWFRLTLEMYILCAMRTLWRHSLVAKYEWSEFASYDPRDEVHTLLRRVFIIIIISIYLSKCSQWHWKTTYAWLGLGTGLSPQLIRHATPYKLYQVYFCNLVAKLQLCFGQCYLFLFSVFFVLEHKLQAIVMLIIYTCFFFRNFFCAIFFSILHHLHEKERNILNALREKLSAPTKFIPLVHSLGGRNTRPRWSRIHELIEVFSQT